VSSRKSSIRDQLPSNLAVEIRTVGGKLRRRLREHGGRHDLTPSQAAVLLRLEKEGPATVSSLARAEGMRPQSMSAIAMVLQDLGLACSAPDPSDGRKTPLSLTPKCLKWLRKGRAAKQDWLTTAISRKLSAHEQEKLLAALELLRRLVDE